MICRPVTWVPVVLLLLYTLLSRAFVFTGQCLHFIVVWFINFVGDGDPPDTARKLWRRLHKKGQPSDALRHLSYTVLGLGDTNYNNFCNFGKIVDKKLQALGGHRYCTVSSFFICSYSIGSIVVCVVHLPLASGIWFIESRRTLALMYIITFFMVLEVSLSWLVDTLPVFPFSKCSLPFRPMCFWLGWGCDFSSSFPGWFSYPYSVSFLIYLPSFWSFKWWGEYVFSSFEWVCAFCQSSLFIWEAAAIH